MGGGRAVFVLFDMERFEAANGMFGRLCCVCPFGVQSALYGLLSWLFACVADLFCARIAAYGAFIGHV